MFMNLLNFIHVPAKLWLPMSPGRVTLYDSHLLLGRVPLEGLRVDIVLCGLIRV